MRSSTDNADSSDSVLCADETRRENVRCLLGEIQYEGNDETTRSVHTPSFKSLAALYTRG